MAHDTARISVKACSGYGATSPLIDDTTLIDESHAEPPKRSCRERSIVTFAWISDAAMILISMIGVILDVLVGLQFANEGSTLWAWLVFGCLISSNVIYSAMVVAFGLKDDIDRFGYYPHLWRPLTKLPAPVLFVLVFPFAQLTPAVHYVFQTFVIKTTSKRRSTHRELPEDEIEVAHATARKEYEAISESIETMGRLRDALRNQLFTHGMLFVDTLVEAIPQSIIQTMAIAFMGSPSGLQVASITLSMLSIVNKGYVLSVSCNLRVFAIKLLMISYDVFSLFYVLSSVVSRDAPNETTIFGSLGVTYMTYIWLFNALATTVLLTLCSAMWVAEKVNDKNRHNFDILVTVLLGAFSSIPASLVLQGMKLTWLMFFLFDHEPPIEAMPIAAMLFSFLRGKGEDDTSARAVPIRSSEWQRRLAHLHTSAYYHFLVKGSSLETCRFGLQTKIALDNTARLQLYLEGRMLEALLKARRERQRRALHSPSAVVGDDAWVDRCKSDEDVERDPVVRSGKMDVLMAQCSPSTAESAIVTRTKLLQREPKLVAEVQAEQKRLAELDFSPREKAEALHDFVISRIYDEERMLHHYFKRWNFNTRLRLLYSDSGQVFRMTFVLFCVAQAGASAYSFLYPLINYSLYFGTQNLLQHVCFGLLSASLLSLLFLAPTFVDYVNFVVQLEKFCELLDQRGLFDDSDINTACVRELSAMIAEYHLPSPSKALRDAVPNSLIPTDVLCVMERFLPDDSLDLTKMTVEQCREVKRAIPL